MPKVNGLGNLPRSRSFNHLATPLSLSVNTREKRGADPDNSLRFGNESPEFLSLLNRGLGFVAVGATSNDLRCSTRSGSVLSDAPTRSGSALGPESVAQSPANGFNQASFSDIREDASSDDESSDCESSDGELFGDEINFSNKDPFDLKGGQSETQRNLPNPIASRLDEVISNMAIREELGESSDDEFAQPFKRRRK